MSARGCAGELVAGARGGAARLVRAAGRGARAARGLAARAGRRANSSSGVRPLRPRLALAQKPSPGASGLHHDRRNGLQRSASAKNKHTNIDNVPQWVYQAERSQ